MRRSSGRLLSQEREDTGLQEREALAREELEARRRLDSDAAGLFRRGLLWEREREGTERCEAREEEGRKRMGRVTGSSWSTGRRRRGREVEERSGAAACDEVEEEAGRGGGWVGLVAGSGGSRGCLERWLGEKGIWEDPRKTRQEEWRRWLDRGGSLENRFGSNGLGVDYICMGKEGSLDHPIKIRRMRINR